MKDLITYINEGIFDEEENLNDLDWYSVTLETLRNAKTEEEFNKYYDILEMCVKKCSSPAPEGPNYDIAKGKRYISFCPGRRKNGLSRELFYGTYSTAYVIEWGTDRRNGIYIPQVINTKFHAPFSKLHPINFLPYYLPKYLDKSFKLMSRDAR